MPQNNTKNILISIALIAFIISTGTFTIYQLAKRQTNTTNTSQTNISSLSSAITSIINSTPGILGSTNENKELLVKFDPYVCGLSVTGFVDKPELIQNLDFVLTNKDKGEIKQSFTPKIDESKNFKILVDDKIITDGIYKLEAKADLINQKSETTETTIEFKKDCANLIQNSTPASLINSSIFSQTTSSIVSSQPETKSENQLQSSSSTQESSQTLTIQSEIPKQIVEAPAINISNISSISSSNNLLVDNSNNPNAVRTGGLDFTAVVAIFLVILSSIFIAKIKTREISFSEIFGKK
jgi:hypothetical protein